MALRRAALRAMRMLDVEKETGAEGAGLGSEVRWSLDDAPAVAAVAGILPL